VVEYNAKQPKRSNERNGESNREQGRGEDALRRQREDHVEIHMAPNFVGSRVAYKSRDLYLEYTRKYTNLRAEWLAMLP
jgi:hypothetical protein